jgi:hypothetical protein
LSLDEVFVNVFDKDFEKLIIKDVNDCVINFTSSFDDYVFMSNFKGSIRHVYNKERDRLMKFLEIFNYEHLRMVLGFKKKKNNEKGGRPEHDVILMFKILVLKNYYNLSDEKTASRIRSDDVYQCFLGYPQ